jgi:hypothetical protein
VIRFSGGQLAERHVAGDSVKPGTQLTDLCACTKRLERAHERLLNRVLCVSVAQQLAAIAKQVTAVAQDDRRECRIVALASQDREVLVGLPQQERRGEEPW